MQNKIFDTLIQLSKIFDSNIRWCVYGGVAAEIHAQKKMQKRMALFDHGLSYAALTPKGFSSFALVLKGLFGLYPGFFSSPPYYKKIAEYRM